MVRIESMVEGLSEEILSYPLDNKWSVKQNIGHLAEVDEIAMKRINEMITAISPMSPAVFEPRGDYNAQSISDVLSFFVQNRIKNLNRYTELSHTELEKSSLHPRLKLKMTPVDLAWFDAEHDDHHLVRINEIISALVNLR